MQKNKGIKCHLFLPFRNLEILHKKSGLRSKNKKSRILSSFIETYFIWKKKEWKLKKILEKKTQTAQQLFLARVTQSLS
jgi:hypothetical protein